MRRVAIGVLSTVALAVIPPAAPASAQPGDSLHGVVKGVQNLTGAGCTSSAFTAGLTPRVDLLEGFEMCSGNFAGAFGGLITGVATSGFGGVYVGEMVCGGAPVAFSVMQTLLRGAGSLGPSPVTSNAPCTRLTATIIDTCIAGGLIREGVVIVAAFGFGSNATIPGCPNPSSTVGGVPGFGPFAQAVLTALPGLPPCAIGSVSTCNGVLGVVSAF